jgi:5-methylcytosine-specific restriction endonuclease McrA
MAHRGTAQRLSGITEKQASGLARGRVKGTNNRAGFRHKPESKAQTAMSNKKYWALNPDKAAARAAKTRGQNHYKWRGGASKLNLSIRQMTENRRWMDSVKARDLSCVRCGSVEALEAHHKKSLSEIIECLSIKSRADARQHAAHLWDLANGETLCRRCHYREHGRAVHAD